jgi:hypothetical protein
MKRFAIRIAAAFLTFTFGLSATQILSTHFYSTAVGSLQMGPDGWGGFTALRSYDGTSVFFAHARFPSHEAAVATFGLKSDTPAKGGGLVDVTASKAVGLNQVDL